MPDLPDTVSPIDGSVIHGRRGMREHNARHGVTNVADYKETWQKAAQKRAEFYTRAPDTTRAREIARAIDRIRK